MRRNLVISFCFWLLLGSTIIAQSKQGATPSKKRRAYKVTAAASPRKEKILVVSDGVLEKSAITRFQANYPTMTRLRVAGEVKVQVIIDIELGEPISAEVISGHPLLRVAALDAARQWRWPPSCFNAGHRVLGKGILTFHFKPYENPQ